MPQVGTHAPKNSIPSLLHTLGEPVQILVTIDSTARDGGKAGGSAESTNTALQPGLVLSKITATGKYKHYDTDADRDAVADDPLTPEDESEPAGPKDGTHREDTAVILMDFVDVKDGDKEASVAVSGGVFKRNELRWNLATDKSGFNWDNTVLDAR